MSKKVKEKIGYIKPINIDKNVWFYPMETRLEFTVYVAGVARLFSISKKVLIKHLTK